MSFRVVQELVSNLRMNFIVVMYSGVEYVVCCYSECISHTRQAEKSAHLPTVVRLIFQLAWCGIYTQSNNTLHNLRMLKYFNSKLCQKRFNVPLA